MIMESETLALYRNVWNVIQLELLNIIWRVFCHEPYSVRYGNIVQIMVYP